MLSYAQLSVVRLFRKWGPVTLYASMWSVTWLLTLLVIPLAGAELLVRFLLLLCWPLPLKAWLNHTLVSAILCASSTHWRGGSVIVFTPQTLRWAQVRSIHVIIACKRAALWIISADDTWDISHGKYTQSTEAVVSYESWDREFIWELASEPCLHVVIGYWVRSLSSWRRALGKKD